VKSQSKPGERRVNPVAGLDPADVDEGLEEGLEPETAGEGSSTTTSGSSSMIVLSLILNLNVIQTTNPLFVSLL
jgi:hypothetical protein